MGAAIGADPRLAMGNWDSGVKWLACRATTSGQDRAWFRPTYPGDKAVWWVVKE